MLVGDKGKRWEEGREERGREGERGDIEQRWKSPGIETRTEIKHRKEFYNNKDQAKKYNQN